MQSDKPKHKPSPKHTLEEVLKSLHDLIRNDLVSAKAAVPAPAPPAAEEPDAFNSALDELDQIITHKLIEPVERARRLPPAPPELVAARGEAWTEDPARPEEDPALGPPDEDIVLESEPAGEAEREPSAAPPDKTQEAFPSVETPAPDKPDEPFEPSYELVDLAGRAAAPPPADPNKELTPPPSPAWDDAATIDFDAPAKPAAQPPENVIEAAAAELQAAAIPPVEPPAETPAAAPAPADDIPVLNDVAHEILAQTDGAALPVPERAREIAIQVIARLNIELRQSGRPPLDPRTIDRLQQLLKDALGRTRAPDERG